MSFSLCLPACTQPHEAPAGKKADVLASYSWGTLEAKLPAKVDVLAVQAAAESELRSRGFVITSANGTMDNMKVVARGGGQGKDEEVTVSAAALGKSTSISVENGLFGNETASRVVMDGVLRRLGR